MVVSFHYLTGEIERAEDFPGELSDVLVWLPPLPTEMALERPEPSRARYFRFGDPHYGTPQYHERPSPLVVTGRYSHAAFELIKAAMLEWEEQAENMARSGIPRALAERRAADVQALLTEIERLDLIDPPL